MSRTMKFGITKKRATVRARPSSQNTGDIAPTALPPSSGSIGARLKRLRRKPT
jgi:hypothetical protein